MPSSSEMIVVERMTAAAGGQLHASFPSIALSNPIRLTTSSTTFVEIRNRASPPPLLQDSTLAVAVLAALESWAHLVPNETAISRHAGDEWSYLGNTVFSPTITATRSKKHYCPTLCCFPGLFSLEDYPSPFALMITGIVHRNLFTEVVDKRAPSSSQLHYPVDLRWSGEGAQLDG